MPASPPTRMVEGLLSRAASTPANSVAISASRPSSSLVGNVDDDLMAGDNRLEAGQK